MSDEAVIRRVTRDCVPVAVNLYTIRARKGSAGDFFRKVQKQRPEMYQGVYVVNAEGKVLSSQGKQPVGKKSWTQDLLNVLDEGIQVFGRVTPRPVQRGLAFRHHGKGIREDGNITLAVYARWTLLGTDPRGLGKPSFDRVDLSRDEQVGLVGKDHSKGTVWHVPVEVVRKLRVAMAADSDRNWLPHEKELSKAELSGKVVRVEDGIAYLIYQGRLTGAHAWEFDPNKGKKTFSDLRLSGVGRCEAKTGKLLSILLLGEGKFRGLPPYDQEKAYGAVIEWEK